MRGDPSVWLVVDREDSVEFAAFVDRLACPSAGRVVCHPIPDDPSGGWLAIDLLLALGKQADGPRAEWIRGRSWQLAATWLQAEEVKHLFVLRAHLLSARALNCLLALPRSAALDLWLIAARPDLRPAARGMLNQIAWQRMSRTRFTHCWRGSVEALPPNSRPSDAAVFPDVPETDFPTFRAACRRLLDPVGFARVDRLYRTVMDQTLRWLDAHARILSHLWELELQAQDFERFVIRGHYYVERRAQVLHTFERTWWDFEHALASYLQDVASSSGSPEETLVRLRGAQAACFHHGLLLRFTLTPQALVGEAHLGPTLDERTTMRLRGLCTPKLTAAATLALVLGRGPATLASLKVGSISAGTGRLEHRRESFTIPPHARAFVRAYQLERAVHGADVGTPLFCNADGSPSSSGTVLRRLLQAVARRLATSIPGITTPGLPGRTWLDCHRLSVTRLAVVPGRACSPCRSG